MIELVLPYPISANRYWRTRVIPGKSFASTYPSTEAKAYKREVAKIAQAHGVRMIAGPVECEIDLYPHLPLDWKKRAKLDPVWWDMTVQCMDLDNARKVMLDALNGIAWTDDSTIRKDGGEIMVPDGEARCVIRVRPYVREQPPLFSVDRYCAPPVKALVTAENPF
jgi:crossover junction endodeoxyribonuclease RusA